MIPLPHSLLLPLLFAFGAAWGSFLNVLVWRLPLGRSTVRPASACPSCRKDIAFYDNIPILSWLLLRGRCRHCAVPISARYPATELAAALLAPALWLHLEAQLFIPWPGGPLIPFVLYYTLLLGLLALSLIDLDWFLLPDRLTLPLILLGLGASLAWPPGLGPSPLESGLGALIAGAIPLVIALVYRLSAGRDGLGGGDIKLLIVLGAWFGPVAISFLLGAASIQALLAALLFRRAFALESLPLLPGEAPPAEPTPDPSAAPPTSPTPAAFRQLFIPLGPFLALAGLEWLFFSDLILGALR